MSKRPVSAITLAGVTFTAEQVRQVELKIEGRKLWIYEPKKRKKPKQRKVGF